MSDLLQFLVSGIQVGAVYALVGLGFAMIYNASHVVNFAQGEFVMIGALSMAALAAWGLPIMVAILAGCVVAVVVAVAMYACAIRPAKGADVVTLIVITIGVSIFLRGAAAVIFGKSARRPESFSGDTSISLFGAQIQPQVFWIVGGALTVFVLLALFMRFTMLGKAMLATANDATMARLVGVNTVAILRLALPSRPWPARWRDH